MCEECEKNAELVERLTRRSETLYAVLRMAFEAMEIIVDMTRRGESFERVYEGAIKSIQAMNEVLGALEGAETLERSKLN